MTTKLLSFAAGVLATVLFLALRAQLVADDAVAPAADVARSGHPFAEPAPHAPVQLARPAAEPEPASDGGPIVSDARQPIVSAEEIERAILERLTSDLPADWISPIDPSWEAEGPRLGGVPHGEWRVRYPDSGLTDVGHFVLGSRQGVWKTYDKSGALWQSCSYVNGKLEGPLEQYQPVWHSWEYRRGELVHDD